MTEQWLRTIWKRSPDVQVTRGLFALVFLISIAGCGAHNLVEAERVDMGGIYSVDPQITWNRLIRAGPETWTIDGPSLQAVRFINGIRSDKPLVRAGQEQRFPVFRMGMTESEIMEFILDSLFLLGFNNLEAHDLRPMEFGSHDGFRFEIRFLSRDGLEEEGLVAGAVIEQRLYLILYTGVRRHYYPKYLNHVEHILDSIELIGQSG